MFGQKNVWPDKWLNASNLLGNSLNLSAPNYIARPEQASQCEGAISESLTKTSSREHLERFAMFRQSYRMDGQCSESGVADRDRTNGQTVAWTENPQAVAWT